MAMQVYINIYGNKEDAIRDFQDPGTTPGAGSRVGVHLMTGTLGKFSLKVHHVSAIKAALDHALDLLRSDTFDETANAVIAAKIGTEEIAYHPTSDLIPWEWAAVEIPAVLGRRSHYLKAAVERAIEVMREELPNA